MPSRKQRRGIPCAICHHPARAEIEAGLLRGERQADLANKHAAPIRSVGSHWSLHMQPQAKALVQQAGLTRDDCLRELLSVRTEVKARLAEIRAIDDPRSPTAPWRVWLDACELICRQTERVARMMGWISEVTVQVQFGLAEPQLREAVELYQRRPGTLEEAVAAARALIARYDGENLLARNRLEASVPSEVGATSEEGKE